MAPTFSSVCRIWISRYKNIKTINVAAICATRRWCRRSISTILQIDSLIVNKQNVAAICAPRRWRRRSHPDTTYGKKNVVAICAPRRWAPTFRITPHCNTTAIPGI